MSRCIWMIYVNNIMLLWKLLIWLKPNHVTLLSQLLPVVRHLPVSSSIAVFTFFFGPRISAHLDITHKNDFQMCQNLCLATQLGAWDTIGELKRSPPPPPPRRLGFPTPTPGVLRSEIVTSGNMQRCVFDIAEECAAVRTESWVMVEYTTRNVIAPAALVMRRICSIPLSRTARIHLSLQAGSPDAPLTPRKIYSTFMTHTVSSAFTCLQCTHSPTYNLASILKSQERGCVLSLYMKLSGRRTEQRW